MQEVYMVIESLYDRMTECQDDDCQEHRKSFHHNMIRLEAKRLLELLGDKEEEREQEELRKNVRLISRAASTIFETFRSEIKTAEEFYKKAKSVKKGGSWN